MVFIIQSNFKSLKIIFGSVPLSYGIDTKMNRNRAGFRCVVKPLKNNAAMREMVSWVEFSWFSLLHSSKGFRKSSLLKQSIYIMQKVTTFAACFTGFLFRTSRLWKLNDLKSFYVKQLLAQWLCF